MDNFSSEREELLEMMALALQVASGIIARKELPDPVDMTTLKEATFESYALILQGMPGIFRQVNAADRREFLETTLLQLRLEQERDLLEQMIEVKGND